MSLKKRNEIPGNGDDLRDFFAAAAADFESKFEEIFRFRFRLEAAKMFFFESLKSFFLSFVASNSKSFRRKSKNFVHLSFEFEESVEARLLPEKSVKNGFVLFCLHGQW